MIVDYTDANQVIAISNELHTCSKNYNTARQLAATAKYNLDIILASKMPEMRKQKSNLGYETARIMILESGDMEILKYYEQEEKQTATYKGLEKIMDALQSQISLIQSLTRNQTKNT